MIANQKYKISFIFTEKILQTEFQTHFHIEKWSLSLNQHDIFNPSKRQLKDVERQDKARKYKL